MITPKILFNPGPVMTSERVKVDLSHPDLSHRRADFEQVVSRLRQQVLRLFRADDQYTSVVISGSGTAANEAALSSLIKDNEEVLLVKNGTFGGRLDEILTCYGFPLHRLEFGWGALPDLDQIETTLRRNPQIQWVCVVYHETSTGMINPVPQIAALAKRYGRKIFTDCVAAAGGEDIDVVRDQFDVCTSSSNKCVAGITGSSFICVRKSIVPELGVDMPRRNVYLSLQKHIEAAERNSQTPNTPAVTSFIALDVALDELFEEGLENRIARYHTCAAILRQGFTRMGLPILVEEPYRANTVTLVGLPSSVKNDDFLKELDRRGYVINYAYGPMAERNMVDVANMGWIMPEDCTLFLQVFEKTMQDMLAKEK